MSDNTNGGDGSSGNGQNGSDTVQKPSKPTEPLPSRRISFPNQLNALQAYAAASGPSGQPVSVSDVGELANVTGSTLSLNNSFWCAIGLLHKSDNKFVPSQEVLSFHRACGWDENKAPQKLVPVLRESWFGRALLPRLTMGPMRETEAIHVLADAAAAGKKYENQLGMCLDYLEASGLVKRQNSHLELGPMASQRSPYPEDVNETQEQVDDPETEDVPAQPALRTAFAKQTEGAVQFHVDVRVDMSELEDWSPDRITAFFAGIAKVLAAKRGLEKEGVNTK